MAPDAGTTLLDVEAVASSALIQRYVKEWFRERTGNRFLRRQVNCGICWYFVLNDEKKSVVGENKISRKNLLCFVAVL